MAVTDSESKLVTMAWQLRLPTMLEILNFIGAVNFTKFSDSEKIIVSPVSAACRLLQLDVFKNLEIANSLHHRVFDYAQTKGLDWFSSPSHEDDVDYLCELDVGLIKVGSDDATNLPLLKYIADKNRPIMLSTGMCNLEEVHEAVNAIYSIKNFTNKLILLHAITAYPTHAEDVNLLAINALQREFPKIDVGYSDHTLNGLACLSAVALGSKVIEKHFTCDKNSNGPDHQLSADPSEMKWIVDSIRKVEIMLGSGDKIPAHSEITSIHNNRKSLIVNQDLTKGSIIKMNDLSIKRPGYGIQPKFFDQVVGRKIKSDINCDHVLTWADLV
jgi:N-acetylneuraminate synthase